MKILLTILCVFVLGATSSALLGKEKCTYGPTYWCSSIQNAKSCGAVKHCIKAVWEKQHVPEDTDSICKICLDMVTQARDQLESNETMEEIREVFDGSCDLIPLKIVKKECKRLADDFIPELVESLASQMNPQVVCTTAGLCNNARIDELLKQYEETQKNKNLLSCEQCNTVGNVISHKFHTSTRDQVLDGFLGGCGRLSSFSDACSSLVLSYFNEMYDELSKNLNSENICHMSGVCSSKFHQHEEDSLVKIETKSNVGVLKNKEATDDMPCELCEQLVKHLRDILVANTTETEFKLVLEGLCKQTKNFKDECVGLVDQYYPVIYETLVNNLDANGACFMIGVCPKGSNMPLIAPSAPFLPADQKFPKKKLGVDEEAIKLMPLPIDRLMGVNKGLDLVDGGELCPICQMFLHFIQEELSDAKNEDEIKEAVGRTCDKFPSGLRGNCHNFVNLYGDAIIALLVQEIDPSELCPTLRFCPKNARDVEVDPELLDVEVNNQDKTSCPLCMLVIKEAEQYVKNEKTKETAKKALEKVCSHLPPKPQIQCQDFVETYYDELLNKLISDLDPKDICSELKLCPALLSGIFRVGIEKLDSIPHVNNGDIATNEIPDSTVNGQPIDNQETLTSGECTLCEMVMTGTEDKVKDGMKREQIEDILFRECSLYRPFENICEKFIKENTDKIVKLLSEDLSPKQVCQQLTLCARKLQDLEFDEAIIVNVVAIPSFQKTVNIPENPPTPAPVRDDSVCVLCEFIMSKLEKELKDKKTREEIRQAVENVCTLLPKSLNGKCTQFIEQYADLIIDLVETVPPKEVCQQMSLCAAVKKTQHLVGDSECTWGPSHFCSNHKIAAHCKATEYCKRKKLGMFA
jgi:saposin